MNQRGKPIQFIDLFSGIGGFRFAAERVFSRYGLSSRCVFSSDIDPYARKAYHANFGEYPSDDITQVNENDIPDHDILFAGFPCQPFSIIGAGKGFDDTRGTLFFDIARILAAKKPRAFILENVKRLIGHDKGKTLKKILHVLRDELGYAVYYKSLNALDYGLPQKRERLIIVGFHKPMEYNFPPKREKFASLNAILEKNADEKYYVSEKIRQKRKASHAPSVSPSIWHENKSGHISSYPYSCALRAHASYNYLLVDGERRLTPREMLRLQGFPDTFKIAVSESQTRKQAGNAVPVNIVEAVFESLLPIIVGDEGNP
ncbi:MAG: DNA (cytosine-5-)-methyltransferase [Anaerolineales bacterium]|nr:DNA (cytosine-5-)-methyltransferase [Anaerolineales bacterium]